MKYFYKRFQNFKNFSTGLLFWEKVFFWLGGLKLLFWIAYLEKSDRQLASSSESLKISARVACSSGLTYSTEVLLWHALLDFSNHRKVLLWRGFFFDPNLVSNPKVRGKRNIFDFWKSKNVLLAIFEFWKYEKVKLFLICWKENKSYTRYFWVEKTRIFEKISIFAEPPWLGVWGDL